MSQYDIMIAHSVQQGSWQAYENTAVDAINKTVKVNGIEGLNGRFILTDKSNPLPITLISFEAKLLDAKVKLSWATASETNNDYFTIEHSENAKNFKPIVIIDGAGNSNTVLRYQAFDNDPVQGVNYYRLKQTDFDGKYSYSQIISVNTGGAADEAAIKVTSFGPNPFSTYFMMTFTAESDQLVNINIFNSGGQLVYSEPYGATSGENTYTYNDHLNLPRGIYLVNISQDKQKTTFTKLIKE
jgi:hypothetical protein